MDNEGYFKLKSDHLPGNDHFYTSDIQTPPPLVKYRAEKKFPIQLIVWICVSRVNSEPVFLERPNSINAKFYQDHCINTALVRFIEKEHRESNIMFWPDLASAHYANSTLQLLESLHIPFVPKTSNPPNIP